VRFLLGMKWVFISQMTIFFIVTVMKTSGLTFLKLFLATGIPVQYPNYLRFHEYHFGIQFVQKIKTSINVLFLSAVYMERHFASPSEIHVYILDSRTLKYQIWRCLFQDRTSTEVGYLMSVTSV
jgi:hypothetical protein